MPEILASERPNAGAEGYSLSRPPKWGGRNGSGGRLCLWRRSWFRRTSSKSGDRWKYQPVRLWKPMRRGKTSILKSHGLNRLPGSDIIGVFPSNSPLHDLVSDITLLTTLGLAPFPVPAIVRVWRVNLPLRQHGELPLGQVPQGAVGPFPAVMVSPSSTFSSASARDRNQFSFKHSCLKRPLKASMRALSVGFPGRLKSSSTPFR